MLFLFIKKNNPRRLRKRWRDESIVIIEDPEFLDEIDELLSSDFSKDSNLTIVNSDASVSDKVGVLAFSFNADTVHSPQISATHTVTIPELYEVMTGKSVISSDYPILVGSKTFYPEKFIRRMVNIIMAAFGLVVTLPFWPILMLIIWLEDFNNPFFIQSRVGKNGRVFKLVKFRTMRVSKPSLDDIDWNRTELPKSDKARLTVAGNFLRRSRLDELPQLLNIIKGDMNAVGPRAEMPEARTVRNKMIPGYDYRLSVRPGMAGWGMMHKYDDLREKFQYDLYYIKYRSIRFDIYIVLETARRILKDLIWRKS